MSDRTRKKKNGERKDKKSKRMRDSVEARHAQAAPPRRSTDQADIQLFKPGSASDHTWQRTQAGEPPGREPATTRPRVRRAGTPQVRRASRT
jgi:hypothetical protein